MLNDTTSKRECEDREYFNSTMRLAHEYKLIFIIAICLDCLDVPDLIVPLNQIEEMRREWPETTINFLFFFF